MSSSFPLNHVLSESRGMLLVGVFINAGALGVLTVQVFLYHVGFTADTIYSKSVVYGVYILEAVQTIMASHTLFRSLIYNFLDPSSAEQIYDLWFVFPILGGIITFIVQLFYARRIILLGNGLGCSNKGGIFILLLSCIQFVAAIMLGVEIARVESFTQVWEVRERLPFVTCNAFGVVCDTVIALYMTIILTRMNAESRTTRKIIRNIVRLTVETGSLTALVSILNIIFSTIPQRRDSYYQVTSTILSKLYANSILVILNSRMELNSGKRDFRRSTALQFADFDIDTSISSTKRSSRNTTT